MDGTEDDILWEEESMINETDDCKMEYEDDPHDDMLNDEQRRQLFEESDHEDFYGFEGHWTVFFLKKRLFDNYSFFYFTSFLHHFSARLIFEAMKKTLIYGWKFTSTYIRRRPIFEAKR